MIHPFFHVPHDGALFPEELMGSVCIPRLEFLHCHELMRDRDVWKMVPDRFRDREHLIRFPVSRLLCDVERFIGPQEIMERYGMGFCYERAYDGRRIKHLSSELLARTKVYYDRHHRLLDACCMAHENVLLIDLHSFSDEIVPQSFLSPDRSTPDVCIGTESAYSDPRLIAIAEQVFRDSGFTTALNYPYFGCMIPNCVLSGRFSGSFRSLMLEFNRRIYCPDGHSDDRSIARLRALIDAILFQFEAFL